eukprot:UN02221
MLRATRSLQRSHTTKNGIKPKTTTNNKKRTLQKSKRVILTNPIVSPIQQFATHKQAIQQ